MARKIKIDSALQKRFAKDEKKKSKEATKEIKVFFLIVCEGEKTEPNYFDSFPKNVSKRVHHCIFEGGKINTLGVVEKAIELRDKSRQQFDRVWAVFDLDNFGADRFNNAIEKGKANDIKCAWSNEAFELWYVLHFCDRITEMSRTEHKAAIEDAISAQMKKEGKAAFKYEKNLPDMYGTLQKYGDQDQAIKRAKQLMKRHAHLGNRFAEYKPCTTVYELVEELTGKSKKLNEEIKEKHGRGE